MTSNLLQFFFFWNETKIYYSHSDSNDLTHIRFIRMICAHYSYMCNFATIENKKNAVQKMGEFFFHMTSRVRNALKIASELKKRRERKRNERHLF